jgi:hypothetical protein
MDFHGLGFITEEDLLNHKVVMARIQPFTREDVKEFSRMFNLFKGRSTAASNLNNRSGLTSAEVTSRHGIGQGNLKNSSTNISLTVQHTIPVVAPSSSQQAAGVAGMNFDQFKRMFFPQLFLINEEQDSDNERNNHLELDEDKP